MDKKIKVYCGHPSIGNTATAQFFQMRNYERDYGDKIEFVWPEKAVYRIFHDYARNEIVKEFLKTDCDVLFMLDADIVPPNRLMELVTKHYDKWLISGASYPIWMNNQIVFTVYGQADQKNKKLELIEVPKVIEEQTSYVDGLATGCLFIKREIFEQHVEMPYFEFVYDEDRKMRIGEDLGFALKLHEKGIKYFTDFSMVCKHYKNVDLLDMSNFVTETSNSVVKKYDAEIRAKVDTLVQQNLQMKQLLQQHAQPPRQTSSGLIIPGR